MVGWIAPTHVSFGAGRRARTRRKAARYVLTGGALVGTLQYLAYYRSVHVSPRMLRNFILSQSHPSILTVAMSPGILPIHTWLFHDLL